MNVMLLNSTWSPHAFINPTILLIYIMITLLIESVGWIMALQNHKTFSRLEIIIYVIIINLCSSIVGIGLSYL
jgi:hypothetical protein